MDEENFNFYFSKIKTNFDSLKNETNEESARYVYTQTCTYLRTLASDTDSEQKKQVEIFIQPYKRSNILVLEQLSKFFSDLLTEQSNTQKESDDALSSANFLGIA